MCHYNLRDKNIQIIFSYKSKFVHIYLTKHNVLIIMLDSFNNIEYEI